MTGTPMDSNLFRALGAYATAEGKIVSDPATSDWLKAALKTTATRDPMAALADARALVTICQLRLTIAQGMAATTSPTVCPHDGEWERDRCLDCGELRE